MSPAENEMTVPLPELLSSVVGRRVVKVLKSDLSLNAGSVLVLDNDVRLELYESDYDCCGHAQGDWVIEPDRLEAIITDFKYELKADRESNGDGHVSRATITLLHNQNPVALAECSATDGNGGYYFSILSLRVSLPGADTRTAVVVEA